MCLFRQRAPVMVIDVRRVKTATRLRFDVESSTAGVTVVETTGDERLDCSVSLVASGDRHRVTYGTITA